MRIAALTALALLSACASTPRERPDAQAAVEAAFADVVASASAPDTDAEAFSSRVAYRGGDSERSWRAPVNPDSGTELAAAASLLIELRAIIRDRQNSDGGFIYQVTEYVHEPTDEADWHVLLLDLGNLEDDETSELEVAFVPGPDGFLLGRIAN